MKNREMLRGAQSLCQGSALTNRDMGLQHSLNSGADEKSNRDFTGSEQDLERDVRTFSLFRKGPRVTVSAYGNGARQAGRNAHQNSLVRLKSRNADLATNSQAFG
jgi:hypothetical protein